MIEMAVRRRRWVSSSASFYGILQDERDNTVARVSAALFSGAIAGVVINPLLDDIDDATLCAAPTIKWLAILGTYLS